MNVENLQNNAIEYNEMKTKKRNKMIITILIAVGVLALVVACFFVFKSVTDGPDTSYIAHWKCTDDMEFIIEENSFSMSYPSVNAAVYGTYELVETKNKDNAKSFLMNFTSNKRIVDGKTTTSPIKVQYEINISKEDENAMIMINSANYSTYNCTREK